MSHIAISVDQDQLATKEITQLLYWESVELLQLGKKNWFWKMFFFFFFVVVVCLTLDGQMIPCMYIANRII